MARDIEDFLRRAAERRKKQQQGGGQRRPQQPPRQQPPRQQPPRQQPLRQQQPPKRLVIEDDDIEIIEPRREQLRKEESVSQHVKRHIDTQDIAEHTRQLGDRIRGEAALIDRTVKQHLNHDLTKIDDRPTVTDDEPPEVIGKEPSLMAVELFKILQTPNGFRQAIMINEILNRPKFED